MRAEIVSVGTELLLGQIVDTNAAYLSRLLAELGIDLLHRTTVGDNFQRVRESVCVALERSDVVITIGGLGPTEDDLTKEAVAESLGAELVPDSESERRIRDFFALRGVPMPERNLKQALVPAVGRTLRNDAGTAPGAVFESGRGIVIVLPGPPAELIPMVERDVAPYLREKAGGAGIIRSRTLKIVELGESAVEDRVKDLLGGSNPTVAPLAHTGEVHLRITAKAAGDVEARQMIAGLEQTLRARLGDVVFGSDEDTLEQAVVNLLVGRGLRLAVAESCTGGMLSQRITKVPGCSAVYTGGVVSYGNEVKSGILGVPEGMLAEFGAVSAEVAQAMAAGARTTLGADIGMGITGIAGPDGGTSAKPVGLVYIALSAPGQDSAREFRFHGGREQVRERSVQAALAMLRRYLL